MPPKKRDRSQQDALAHQLFMLQNMAKCFMQTRSFLEDVPGDEQQRLRYFATHGTLPSPALEEEWRAQEKEDEISCMYGCLIAFYVVVVVVAVLAIYVTKPTLSKLP